MAEVVAVDTPVLYFLRTILIYESEIANNSQLRMQRNTEVTALTRRTVLQGLTALGATAAAPLAHAQTATLNVVATTGMIADAARAVGGDLVEVKALMGPGIDPHAYRQTRPDILAMTRADLVLWNGLYLEAQMENFLVELGRRSGTHVQAVTEAMDRTRLLSHDDYENQFDPHVWMDPTLWSQAVLTIDFIFAALIGKKSGDMSQVESVVETLHANEQAYQADLKLIDGYSRKVLATVPEASRVLITAHDAFNYFGQAYGFEVVGIQGISTESEAGVNRIRELVDTIVGRGIKAVFVESSVSDRSIRALVEGAEAQGHELKIGGELYSDAMGEPGTYEGTYLGMIDHNVTTIARALGGTAPERGVLGKLNAGS